MNHLVFRVTALLIAGGGVSLELNATAQIVGKTMVMPWFGISYKHARGTTVEKREYVETSTGDVVTTDSDVSSDNLDVDQKLGLIVGHIFASGWMLGASWQRDTVVQSIYSEELVTLASAYTGEAGRYADYDFTQENQRDIVGPAVGFIGSNLSFMASYFLYTQVATKSELKLYDSAGNILTGKTIVVDYKERVTGWRYDVGYRWPFGWFALGGGVSMMRTRQVSDMKYDLAWLLATDRVELPTSAGSIHRDELVVDVWPTLSFWASF